MEGEFLFGLLVVRDELERGRLVWRQGLRHLAPQHSTVKAALKQFTTA